MNPTQEDDIEKEIAELKKEEKEESPKKTSRNEKDENVTCTKAIELTKKVEQSVSIEQQMISTETITCIDFICAWV